MSSMPECFMCGNYVHHGSVLCEQDIKNLFSWINDIYKKGFTKELEIQGMFYYKLCDYFSNLSDEQNE